MLGERADRWPRRGIRSRAMHDHVVVVAVPAPCFALCSGLGLAQVHDCGVQRRILPATGDMTTAEIFRERRFLAARAGAGTTEYASKSSGSLFA